LRAWQIVLIASAAIFVVGMLLSIYFNTMFLFLFLPFGFAWGFGSRRGAKRSAGTSQDETEDQQPSWTTDTTSPPQFCSHCGRRLGDADLFCPTCGRPIQGRINNGDLR